jgi:hypothetical protein
MSLKEVAQQFVQRDTRSGSEQSLKDKINAAANGGDEAEETEDGKAPKKGKGAKADKAAKKGGKKGSKPGDEDEGKDDPF